MSKASDLRSHFGRVDQKQPIYLHTDQHRNVPVPGIKSDKLKFSRTLCGPCNNERTQPHDRAWETLSRYLRERQPPITPNLLVRLNPAFPGRTRVAMLQVHLYFAKLFGCLITESSIPMDTSAFAQAILGNCPHSKLHLRFCAISDPRMLRMVGQSKVQTASLHGTIVFASWFYYVGRIAVNVMYAEPTERRRGLVHSWHPSSATRLLRITAADT